MSTLKFKTGTITLCILLWAALAAAKQPYVKGHRLDFKLPDLNDEIVSSSDQRFEKKVLLVTLSGPWCPLCVSEIPAFNRLQTHYGEDGFAVVAIAFDRGPAEEAWKKELRNFVKIREIDYLVLNGGSTDAFSETLPMIDDVQGLPVEILIARSGRVVDCRNGRGYDRNWEKKLEGRIKRLLSEEH